MLLSTSPRMVHHQYFMPLIHRKSLDHWILNASEHIPVEHWLHHVLRNSEQFQSLQKYPGISLVKPVKLLSQPILSSIWWFFHGFFHRSSSRRLGLQNDCAGLLEAQVARTLQGNEKTMAAIPGHAPGKPTENPWKTYAKSWKKQEPLMIIGVQQSLT